MKLLPRGTELDGFVIGECIHHGGMAHIYRVQFATGQADPGFPMVMKVPRMAQNDGAENLVGFEIESQIMQAVSGEHVPRFVAVGDLEHTPYLVMEYIQGHTVQHWLQRPASEIDVTDIAHLSAAMAHAAHALHQQNAVHLDLKPANVMIRPDGRAVLLDFGLSCHAHYPDLLAEKLCTAVGSPIWIAPEQVVGVRGDPRSDIFAIGVMLYELCTGKLPFGKPHTQIAIRKRLWMDPMPPRHLRPDLPEWLQEIILRCLEPEAARRYPSAAHLAFDLSHPSGVCITDRGRKTVVTGFGTHLKRWIRAAARRYHPSPLPAQQADEIPIILVAIAHKDVSDSTLYALRQAAQRSLGTRPGARLACVTVIEPGQSSPDIPTLSQINVHRRYLLALRQWAQPLSHSDHRISYHVLESNDVAQALLDYARGNHVSVIVMGAATHGLRTQRFVTTVPIKVAMYAPCTVILVKQSVPFEQLPQPEPEVQSPSAPTWDNDLGPLG